MRPERTEVRVFRRSRDPDVRQAAAANVVADEEAGGHSGGWRRSDPAPMPYLDTGGLWMPEKHHEFDAKQGRSGKPVAIVLAAGLVLAFGLMFGANLLVPAGDDQPVEAVASSN